MRWILFFVAVAVVAPGCKPATSPAPITPVSSAAPTSSKATPPPLVKPNEILLLDEKYETGPDVWIATWSFLAGSPIDLKCHFAGSNAKLDSQPIAGQAGAVPVSGHVKVEMKRSGKKISCVLELQQAPSDGSPPSMSSYINLAPLTLEGKLDQIVREKWRSESPLSLTSSWTLLEYKEKGKWIPVTIKASLPSPKTSAPKGGFKATPLK